MKSSSKKESKALKAEFPIVYKRIGQQFEKQRVVIFTNENEEGRHVIKSNNLAFTCVNKRKFTVTSTRLKSILYHFESSNPNITTRSLDSMVSEHSKLKYIIIYLVEMTDIDDGLKKLDDLMVQTPPVYISKNAFDTYQQYKFLFDNPHNKHTSYMTYLNYQNIDMYYTFSHHMFRNLRHFLFNNLTDEDNEHILIFSSCILGLTGVRNINDIDILVWKPLNELSYNAQKALFDISQNNVKELQKKDGKSFIDISINGTDTWPDYWDIHLGNWARECGASSFAEIVYDRRFHMCFLGLKVTRLEVDIERRILRNRPSSMMDLIILRDIADYRFYIPSIPLSHIDYKKKKYITESEQTMLLKDGYTETKNELYKHVQIDRHHWLKTIQSYGKRRYNKDFSIKELANIIPSCEVINI